MPDIKEFKLICYNDHFFPVENGCVGDDFITYAKKIVDDILHKTKLNVNVEGITRRCLIEIVKRDVTFTLESFKTELEKELGKHVDGQDLYYRLVGVPKVIVTNPITCKEQQDIDAARIEDGKDAKDGDLKDMVEFVISGENDNDLMIHSVNGKTKCKGHAAVITEIERCMLPIKHLCVDYDENVDWDEFVQEIYDTFFDEGVGIIFTQESFDDWVHEYASWVFRDNVTSASALASLLA